MCIVIDINALASVLNRSSADHDQFSPVLTWISDKKGKVVYGGKKYKDELQATQKYSKFIALLSRFGKTVKLNDAKVDNAETAAKKMISDKKFNDPHIAAIVIVSKCCLVCTKDKDLMLCLKDLRLYPKGVTKPSLYTGNSNEDLLTDKYIAEICKPSVHGTKELKHAISILGS